MIDFIEEICKYFMKSVVYVFSKNICDIVYSFCFTIEAKPAKRYYFMHMKWVGNFKATFKMACFFSFKMQGLFVLVDKNW